MTTSRSDQRNEQQIAAIEDLRRQLANGFSFVRSREVVNSIASVSLEECIAQAISNLRVDRSDIRPSRLTRITQLKEVTLAAVDQAMEMPDDAFDHPDQGSANTEE